MNSKKS